jgi:hypothetical protein
MRRAFLMGCAFLIGRQFGIGQGLVSVVSVDAWFDAR